MAIDERSTRAGASSGDGLGEEWRRAQAEMRQLGSAVGDITDELRTLFQREGELAQAEVADSTDAIRGAGIWGGAAAIIALPVIFFLGLGLMYGLATVLELWAAALITALVFAVIAAVCGMVAMRQMREFSLVPKRTLRSMQEDVKWARERIKRNAA